MIVAYMTGINAKCGGVLPGLIPVLVRMSSVAVPEQRGDWKVFVEQSICYPKRHYSPSM